MVLLNRKGHMQAEIKDWLHGCHNSCIQFKDKIRLYYLMKV